MAGVLVARPNSRSLDPGQSSALVATLDTSQLFGSFRREIWVETNDRTTPLVHLSLFGRAHK